MKEENNQPQTANDPSPAHEALAPFQAASVRFLEANSTAQEKSDHEAMQAWFQLLADSRKVELETSQAMIELTRKHIAMTAEYSTDQSTQTMESMYYQRAKVQLDYEREVRQLCTDTQAKLAEMTKNALETVRGNSLEQLLQQRQSTYQGYLADLQQAWSTTQTLDPQTLSAIAAQILFTMNVASQGAPFVKQW